MAPEVAPDAKTFILGRTHGLPLNILKAIDDTA